MGVSGDTQYNPAIDRRIPNFLATPWALWGLGTHQATWLGTL